MEKRLQAIASTLAQSAIDAYSARATFMYLSGIIEPTVRLVYDELLIGAKTKADEHRLAKNVAKVAILSYWRMTGTADTLRIQSLDNEDDTCFRRAMLATLASLKRMINTTNYQRRSAH